MCGWGGGLFALHGSVNHLEEVALHRSVLYRLCVGGWGGGGLFALHGSVNHLEEVALHRSVLYRLCVGGLGGGLFALHGSVNHLEEVALHRSVLYRLCVWVGWGTVCTAWFSAVLIIWRRLPYTGQCCINCVCVLGGGGGELCALHVLIIWRLPYTGQCCIDWGGGRGGLMVHAMLNANYLEY